MDKRRIFLVRHGRPDFPLDDRRCIGRTDVKLGALGRMQALLLGDELRDTVPGGVYCSRLLRASETASYLSTDYAIIQGFEEADAGEWDGKSFEEIKSEYPELYLKRGECGSIDIPGAENASDALRRFREALDMLMLLTHGDIAVVSHATVTGAFLATCNGGSADDARKYRLPYGGYCVIEYDGDYRIASDARLPICHMTPDLCLRLQDAAGLLPNIRRHCRAVSIEALRIADNLEEYAGIKTDRNLIECASLLHDIARLEHHHEQTGGEYVRILGAEEAGNIIAQHDGPCSEKISEATIVYIADKLIKEESSVTVEERYTASHKKCTTPEGMEYHRIKKQQAVETAERINKACSREVIRIR